MYYFISVNYNSSGIVNNWIMSIRKHCNTEHKIIIVDNYSTKEERMKIRNLSNDLNFILIESDNVGYGAGLNKGLDYIYKTEKNYKNIIVFAGNMDLIYQKISENLPDGNFVYVPKIYEGKRNRNPFLTKLQRKIIFLYKFAASTKSPFIYYIVISINKLIGFIPSKIWAVHGSLFCFRYILIDKKRKLFNDKSFLYGEELEFASYVEDRKFKFLESEIIAKHNSHITTQHVVTSTKKFLNLWIPSFNNWITRWNKKHL